MRSILIEIGLWIAHWWQGDRIRVSSSEGRLLRLRAGQRVLIFGRIWNVEATDVKESDDSAGTNTRTSCLRVRLTNTDSTDDSPKALLEVPLPSDGQPTKNAISGWLITSDGQRTPITDADVVPAESPV
ncbi:MAG: hypothetical protein JNM43_21930 [Planctomycetaceae bacterium]|nr:hypothetical protein [Planctomycetaceae bacterium]